MIITIGRQHGSNGHDIARALAEALGCPCYDKEIPALAAENSEFSREILDSYDEKRVSPYVIPTTHYFGMSENFRLNMQVASVQFDTIRSLAEKEGDAVFVGRCADYILRSRKDLLRVFIRAEEDFRVHTLMARKGLEQEQAKKLMKQVDKDRGSFYRYYTDQSWGEAGNFDLCVDSGRLGVDGAVKVILAAAGALKEKNEQA